MDDRGPLSVFRTFLVCGCCCYLENGPSQQITSAPSVIVFTPMSRNLFLVSLLQLKSVYAVTCYFRYSRLFVALAIFRKYI